MKLFKNRIVPALLTAVVLIVGINATTYAATGGKFVLGFVNKAGRPSTLVNTKAGPALQLSTSTAYPPLAVNSTKKVANLNADTVDGIDSSAFAGPLVWHKLTPAEGWYGGCVSGAPAYAVRLDVVYLRGDVCDGFPGSVVFTLPPEARPVREPQAGVYLTAAQVSGTTGRIFISPVDGVVSTQADPDHPESDAGLVSLEGLSYTK